MISLNCSVPSERIRSVESLEQVREKHARYNFTELLMLFTPGAKELNLRWSRYSCLNCIAYRLCYMRLR